MADCPLVIAAAGRPYPGESRSGDAWAAHWQAGGCRLALVDGLGHGPAAAAAADAALALLDMRPELGPAEALCACDAALRGTRGAALALAQIDAHAGRLTYAGVGNIEARLWIAGQWQRPISYRGIVGGALPRVRVFEFTLSAPWLLVMHTDGVRDRFELDLATQPGEGALQTLAESLLHDWARPTDDATIVLAAPRRFGS
jgi:serine phosphatase RsbU (regulator of sigma subunit)